MQPIEELILKLSRAQREVINQNIALLFSKLSNRSQNALTVYLERNIGLRSIVEKILTNPNFNFLRIRNAGLKSSNELKSFVSDVENCVYHIYSINDEKQLLSHDLMLYLENQYGQDTIPADLIQSQSIFRLVDYFLTHNKLFHGVRNPILKMAIRVKQDQPDITLDAIGQHIDLTRERVRQLRNACLLELGSKLSFVKKAKDDLTPYLGDALESNLLFIDDNAQNKINSHCCTSFSKGFISIILQKYLEHRHALVGNCEDVLFVQSVKHRDRHHWKGLYLVDKTIAQNYDFVSFVDRIAYHISARRDEPFSIDFLSYISSFTGITDLSYLFKAKDICETILMAEFDLYLDENDALTFERTIIKKNVEYLVDALRSLGEPNKLESIIEEVQMINPSLNLSEGQFRSLLRNPLFVAVGKESLYGLSEWELERDDFKGGTIRRLVFDYLRKKQSLATIREICDYVLRYRPHSNERSIIGNLKIDTSLGFIFFGGGFVGLKSIKYPEDFTLLDQDTPKIESWDQRFEQLKLFVYENYRLPFSSGVPYSEIRIYRWYKIQFQRSVKGQLDVDKDLLFRNLTGFYQQNKPKQRGSKEGQYLELLNFIETHKRSPSARRDGESLLYGFLYRQRSLLHQDKLSGDEVEKLNAVLDRIKFYKNGREY